MYYFYYFAISYICTGIDKYRKQGLIYFIQINDGHARKHLFQSFELFRGRDQLKAIYLDPKDFKRLEHKKSGKSFLAILTQVRCPTLTQYNKS